MAHKTVRMAQRRGSDDYRRVSESEYLSRADRLTLEGVDGDELANTVTYWYVPRGEES